MKNKGEENMVIIGNTLEDVTKYNSEEEEIKKKVKKDIRKM